MQQAIVITTTPEPNPFLQNLLYSMKGYDKYPIVILSDYGYELGKIKFMMEHTDFDEFFLIHDTCEIIDVDLFDMSFDFYKGKSVSLDPSLRSYLAKYRRCILEQMTIPTAKSKLDAVNFEETFNEHYKSLDKSLIWLTNNFNSSNVFEEKFGRNNMVLECKWLKKYKHIWNRDMICQTKE